MVNQEAVVIVGAGMGGLAAALELAAAGREVTVVERSEAVGGKVHEVEIAGARIASGPTVLTMRWVFDEIFAGAGASLEGRVGLERAEVLARHAWSEREHLDVFADAARTADALGRFAGSAAARGYAEFRRRAREVYEILEASFIRAQRPTVLSLATSSGGVGRLLRIKPFETMWRELGLHFTDARLRQLFGRYATYCGSSPFLAPATLILVAHVELEGVWRVRGGMQRLPEAMAALAVERGVTLRLGETAREVVVERGRIAGVTLATGERVAGGAVVLNADPAAVELGLFGAAVRGAVARVPPEARSLSAVTVSAVAPTRGFALSHHNVFFSRDYEAEFRDVLELRRLPREPTVYVCAQDRGDEDGAGEDTRGAERLFFIVNAPAVGDGHPGERAEIERCVERVLAVTRRCGLEVEMTSERRTITTPQDFERRFPATGGALYGRATHGAMASFQRPGSRTRIPGLYLAGGGVHPGPGVPMAALSGRLAARSVLEDSRSTARSRPADTRGGTSTR